MAIDSMKTYLQPTYFLDSDALIIKELIESITADKQTDVEKAVALFYWVRDAIPYNVYNVTEDPADYKASAIIKRKVGWCVPKAVTLAAMARAAGIPSRLHFADIQNFQISDKLLDIMKTNMFYYHGYTEIYISDAWMKATPAFNKELCDNMGHQTVEFDGVSDGMLPAETISGEKHIEYIKDRGVYDDLPFNVLFDFFRKKYPPLADFSENHSGFEVVE